MKTALLTVILLLPAFAAAKTGNELQGECSVALKLFSNEAVSGNDEFTKIGKCIGFVTGVMEAAALGKTSPGNGLSKEPLRDFCAPPELSVEQVVRTAIERLKNHPEELGLDAAAIVLRAMNEAFPPSNCIGGPGRQAEGLRWPDPPKKTLMRVRLVALALAEPRSSFFSSHEELVADTEIADEEWTLIKLVFTYLPYQPRLGESDFDYSVVHEIAAWRNTDCDETVEELTARSLPDRHEPLVYARNVPRVDLDRRRIPLPCYETKADDYVRASLEPIAPPPKPPRPVLVRPELAPTPSAGNGKVSPDSATEPSRPVLKVRPAPE